MDNEKRKAIMNTTISLGPILKNIRVSQKPPFWDKLENNRKTGAKIIGTANNKASKHFSMGLSRNKNKMVTGWIPDIRECLEKLLIENIEIYSNDAKMKALILLKTEYKNLLQSRLSIRYDLHDLVDLMGIYSNSEHLSEHPASYYDSKKDCGLSWLEYYLKSHQEARPQNTPPQKTNFGELCLWVEKVSGKEDLKQDEFFYDCINKAIDEIKPKIQQLKDEIRKLTESKAALLKVKDRVDNNRCIFCGSKFKFLFRYDCSNKDCGKKKTNEYTDDFTGFKIILKNIDLPKKGRKKQKEMAKRRYNWRAK